MGVRTPMIDGHNICGILLFSEEQGQSGSPWCVLEVPRGYSPKVGLSFHSYG